MAGGTALPNSSSSEATDEPRLGVSSCGASCGSFALRADRFSAAGAGAGAGGATGAASDLRPAWPVHTCPFFGCPQM